MKKCKGCEYEMLACYLAQENGLNAGLDWSEGHCFFELDIYTTKKEDRN